VRDVRVARAGDSPITRKAKVLCVQSKE